MSKGDEDWMKKCMEYRVEGRRPVGRPRRTWLESVVVVRLPRPMEGNGVTPIFRSLQNCQFHHRRLEIVGTF